MNVIAPRAIREFSVQYPESEVPLRTWYNNLRRQDFLNFVHLSEHFVVDVARSKQKDTVFIFDVAGNKYRVVCYINFENQTVFIRHVLTHLEYNEWNKRGRPS